MVICPVKFAVSSTSSGMYTLSPDKIKNKEIEIAIMGGEMMFFMDLKFEKELPDIKNTPTDHITRAIPIITKNIWIKATSSIDAPRSEADNANGR